MLSRHQYKTLAALKSAMRRRGLQLFSHDIIKSRATGVEFPNGFYFAIFFCDGYEDAEQDRSAIRALGFQCQKRPSTELGYKQAVESSFRNEHFPKDAEAAK